MVLKFCQSSSAKTFNINADTENIYRSFFQSVAVSVIVLNNKLFLQLARIVCFD